MPETTPPTSTENELRAKLRAEALVEERTALEKLTKAELVERVQQARTESEDAREQLRAVREAGRGRQSRPEDGFVVAALVDLYRAATQAGRPDAGRFLDAAVKLGAPIADFILGDAPTE